MDLILVAMLRLRSLARRQLRLLDNRWKQLQSAIAMKSFTLRMLLVTALAIFGLFAVPAHAQQNASESERLDRLERRVNEIAQQQGVSVHQDQSTRQDQSMHQDKRRRDLHGLVCMIIFGAIIFNILIAIWIFTDIRRRGTGAGIFIVLALVAGVPAAIIYALVRIGDAKLVEPVRTL
jgi:hypothetical protein